MRSSNTEQPSDAEVHQQILVAAMFAVVTFCAGVILGAVAF